MCVASVFVEKLLREVPDVQKIFLLVRAKNEEAAMQRLKTEIIDCELFTRLKNAYGERYEEFMRSKLVAVVGNICDPWLGMNSNDVRVIADQVNVIISIAGTTKWHERYDVLLDLNVRGLSRLLNYAMDCKKLDLFLHVSSAYVNRETLEVVLEKPIVLYESITERQNNSNSNSPTLPVELDIENELKMVAEFASTIPNNQLPTEMAKLGIRRAKIHGLSSGYLVTKDMGEMLITRLRDKLPSVIIRPPFIESCFREPVSGWIEGYRGMDPMIISYGKGQLQGICADPASILDVVSRAGKN
ncbi:fatty acyl-CoA reductase 2, chloroplastic-like [Spinacia oleracea]|uniref:Fatty acyl-CoA reductase n=1 Tax=Spinacia oleracea TaxID=3562 RepID=A0A9R0K2Q5_SPIOL|nr:fatty acyl-CoA reductase 2, chloroplastic-like [Spinacia oleracea]